MSPILMVLPISLILLIGFVLARLGGAGLKKDRCLNAARSPDEWPSAAVIVPAAGSDPLLPECLTRLLNQDYPDYQLVVTTQELDEPAAVTVRTLIAGRAGAIHVCAGAATSGGQKNHNLLAGLAAADPDKKVLVFCDATRLAEPNFLRELIKPLALGQGVVSSGYHHILAAKWGPLAAGRAFIVLALNISRGLKGLVQPWGGASALWKITFKTLEVDKIWASNMVDDVSLAKILEKADIPVISTPAADLDAPLAAVSLSSWVDWQTRQWLYLKFIFPGTWALFGIFCYFAVGLALLSAGFCLSFPLGWVSWTPALAGAVFLLLASFIILDIRDLHPRPGPWPIWLAGFFVALFLAGFTHWKTISLKHLDWRGKRYLVTWGGKVLGIEELNERA